MLGDHRLGGPEPDRRPDRIGAGKEATRGDVVDDRRARPTPPVGAAEVAAAAQYHTHRAEVVRAHHTVAHSRHFRGRGTAGDRENLPPIAAPERERGGGRGGAYAGQRAHAREERVEEHPGPRHARVLALGERDGHGEQMLRVEAGLHPRDLHQAADEEPRAHEQHDGQRHLCRDQRVAHSSPRDAGRAAPALAERAGHVGARRLECRREPEPHRGHEGQEERDAERPPAYRNLVHPRQLGRRETRECGHPGDRHERAGHASEHAEQQALGEKLARDAGTAGAEPHAERDLLPPRGAAGKEQVGEIAAGDEEHQPDRAEEREEHGANVLDDLRTQPHEVHAPYAGARMLGGDARRDPRELGRGPRYGDAGPQAADDLEEVVAARVQRVARREGERYPQLRLAVGEAERRRHHTDDGEWLPIDGDCAAHDTWVGTEASAPRAVAQEEHAMRAVRTLAREEGTAELRRYAEHREERGAHARAGDALRLAATTRQREHCRGVGRECRDTLAALLELADVGRRAGEGLCARLSVRGPYGHEPVRSS